MKKTLTILLAFAVLTIWYHEVHVILSPNDAIRSSNLKRTEISEELVLWTVHGLFLHKRIPTLHDSSWYKFIPHSQIVVVEKKDNK